MEPITTMLSSAIEKVAEVSEVVDNKFMKDVCPDFLKPIVSDVPMYEIKAATHSACEFFGMPDIPIVEGDSIGVYTLNPETVIDDVFQYNKEQFKDMGLSSFEDQTKVWSHECGHRIIQRDPDLAKNSWANELGADVFVGVREELLGLGNSNFERILGATKPSESHPGGVLRLKAIEFGRQIVAEMRRNGIVPTWENCLEEFKKSDFAKMSYETHGHMTFSTTFIDAKDLHPQISKELKGFTQADIDWCEHQARITSGSEQSHWLKEAQWRKNHLHGLADTAIVNNTEDLSEISFKGYTQADVDWLEHQVRITSGSEQAHWIEKLNWAISHLNS